MANTFIIGGVLLALIEGLGIAITRAMAPPEPSFELSSLAAPPPVTTILGGETISAGSEPVDTVGFYAHGVTPVLEEENAS